MRLLPVRTDHVGGGAASEQSAAERRRDRRRHGRQHLPLRNLPANPQGDPSRGRVAAAAGSAVLSAPPADSSRRDFCKGAAARRRRAGAGVDAAGLRRTSPIATTRATGGQLNAWLKVAADNSITIVVDRSEMGQGVYTALPMLLAEELEIDLDADQHRRGAGGRCVRQRPQWRPDHRDQQQRAGCVGEAAHCRVHRRAPC